jgi:UDP-N-acetylglucosamine--N-acetylmuramyl-(pentapeptide) pyrophosphoryl-undecaprenol N-acetylglucosamine transferase
MRVPVVLIPYPSAADNHQFYNAWAFVESGAARMLEQEKATPEMLAEMVKGLMEKPDLRAGMKEALAKWHPSDAAGQIAAQILEAMARNGVRFPAPPGQSEQSVPGPVRSGREKMQTAHAE